MAASSANTEKGRELSNNNLVVIMLLISFLVVGATVIVGKVLITNILLDTKVVAAKQKADDQVKEDLQNAPDLVKSYQNLGAQAGVLADALPNTSDFPALIVQLENMTNDAGLQLKSVSPQNPNALLGATTNSPTATGGTSSSSSTATTPQPQAYNFGVEFAGTYDGLQRFMDRVETSARPIKVTTMQLSGKGSALSGTLDLTTYYQDKATLPFSTETIK